MEYKRKIYRIPTNFKDSGHVFNGMIPTRNAIDAGWLAILGFVIASILPFSEGNKLTGYVFCIAGLGMVGIIGIQEVPVSTYLFDLYKWSRRRKPHLYNNHGGSYSVTAADVMLSTPGFRDTLADAIEKVRDSMRSKKPEYIEGETFQFAVDPELEELEEAERQMYGTRHEQSDAAPTTDSTDSTEYTQSDGKPFDFNDIARNIVLHDIEEDS